MEGQGYGESIERIVVRSDRYYLEPVNAGESYLVLEDLSTRIKWSGRLGRLLIVREIGRWFAYIPIEVGAEPPNSNPRGYIKGEFDRTRQREPRGDETAFIDMGLNNLFAIVTTSQSTRDLMKRYRPEPWDRLHVGYLRAVLSTRRG